MKYVIIGNSAAAIGGVEGIRQTDSEGKITIISNENHHTYSRPLISYLLGGKTDSERMKYRGNDFYQKNKVETFFGKTVESIDKEGKFVVLNDGTKVEYDKLLLATGSSPFVPPMKGLETVQNKFNFMTLDDALALSKVLTTDSKVLIVGAGLIGLKCAEGIFSKVKSITVVDLANRILPSILDEDASKYVQQFLHDKGIKFELQASVAEFSNNTATLSNGKKTDFDIVVLAVGVRPNVALAKQVGANCERGILTDDMQQTSVEDIYSAGDCTQSFDVSSNSSKILAILPNAYMQGEVAGKNMAQNKTSIQKLCPFNSMGMFELHMVTAGNYSGESVTSTKDGYRKFFFSDDKLNGFILIGNIEKAGIYTNLIRERTLLSTLDFEGIIDNPSLAAFSADYRKQVLAGAK